MNLSKNDLVKNFTIGFLPIVIFLVADLLYGAMTSIVIALLFGFGEFLFLYLKNIQI